MLRSIIFGLLLGINAVVAQAQQPDSNQAYCQNWKVLIEEVISLRQNHPREQLEQMLIGIGIDMDIFYPFLDGAYNMPAASNPTELEMHKSGLSTIIYVNCLASEGFKNPLPQ